MTKSHGDHADELIAAEVAKQDHMWGEANDRADASKGQILDAALAQCAAVAGANYLVTEFPREDPVKSRAFAFDRAKMDFYPKDWSGFRDYGSDVANLVVAAAYLRNEIKRRISNGESTERMARRADQPYGDATRPNP